VDLVTSLAALVGQLRHEQGRVVVGIDGPDAAGKTTLADRLADALPGPVHRVSGDDHVHSAPGRYSRGELSPEGYYRDLFDLDAFLAACDGEETVVADGVFLHRPELRDRWTLSVYLRISEDESLRRALVRDAPRFGTPAEVRRRYSSRYLPGQRLYRAECDPEAAADVLVDNEDPAEPVIERWSSGARSPEGSWPRCRPQDDDVIA
jgi:uridine kinase